MQRWMIMLILFSAIAFWPGKLQKPQLLGLAFVLWIIGGEMLFFLGAGRLMESGSHGTTELMIGWGIAMAIGVAKGLFVLSKTARKNITRILALEEAQKPIHVYSVPSWITIGLMMGLAITLNTMSVDPFWRGVINVGIGTALVTSSFAYWSALQQLRRQPIANS
jgi:hypothetical protein